MATKIRRCLFVGLGGTGMRSLLATKKLFYDTYGEIPPMVGFLGIDTDGGAYKKELVARDGSAISLAPSEQMKIQVSAALPIYQQYKNNMTWVPGSNVGALVSMMLGAGQVRTNGRFALAVNHAAVEHKIKECETKISNAEIRSNASYELLPGNTEVHIAFSFSGGTGSGTFIDVAYIIKDLMPDSKICGYAVLPDVFTTMASGAAMAKVEPNAYGAITDLDYLMSLDPRKSEVKLKYIKDSDGLTVNTRPFNAFFVVDNKNEENDTYTQVDHLADMLALTWVTASGELSVANASIGDNVDKTISEGVFNVDDKIAWVAGLGVCELVFKSSELSKLFSLKASRQLIRLLLNSTEDVEADVFNWIGTNKIREDGGDEHNDVIDYFLNPSPQYPFGLDKSDYDDPMAAFSSCMENNKFQPDERSKKLDALKGRVFASLYEFIKGVANTNGGISKALEAISTISANAKTVVGELKQEIKAKQDMRAGLEGGVKAALDDVQERARSFFKRGLEASVEEAEQSAMSAIVNEREIARREAGMEFFYALDVELGTLRKQVEGVKEVLEAAGNMVTTQLTEIQNGIRRNGQVFQIDLIQSFVDKVEVSDADIVMSDFLNSLEGNKVFGFNTKQSDEVRDLLVGYCCKLNKAQEWGKKTIDDCLGEMSEEELDRVTKLALNKSMPLLSTDSRGFVTELIPEDEFFVGVNDKENNRLTKGDYLKNKIEGALNVTFVNIGSKERIVLYRQRGVYPAFMIDRMLKYGAKHDAAPERYHFNADIFEKMRRDEYDIMPRKKQDFSLEMWVNGFIFGLLKNEDGKYYVKDTSNKSAALVGYWVELSDYRDEAYDKFRSKIGVYEPVFRKEIENKNKQQGQEQISALLDDVRQNYLEKYSQVGLDIKTIQSHGYERVHDLINNEIDYVTNKM